MTELSSKNYSPSESVEFESCSVESGPLLLPNLIIPGVQKCGTSSLYTHLSSHPQCVMSEPKEPNFFSCHWQDGKIDEYLSCFRAASPGQDLRIVGDASTTYFSDADAPGRIKQTLGNDTRIVVLLRNPVERAASAYWHMAKRSAERRTMGEVFPLASQDLVEAIKVESAELRSAETAGRIRTRDSERVTGSKHWNFQYLGNSTYLNPLKNYVDTFGRDQVLVVVSEELAGTPEPVLRRLSQFLDIDPGLFEMRHQRINSTFVAKLDPISRSLHFMSRRLPGGPLRWLKKSLYRVSSRARPQTPRHIKEWLIEMFQRHNQHLSRFLGRDLSVWDS